MTPRPLAARLLTAAAMLLAMPTGARQPGDTPHDMHAHAMATPAAPPVFVASTAKPFAALMADAMAVMDAGMAHAPMNGNPEHDFVAMMLPHHQGAIDMAKSVLLHTQDPELRNLALGIIAEQQNEINVMRAWLQHHPRQGERK
jgi:uncharacterized protein (DUF305 family)